MIRKEADYSASFFIFRQIQIEALNYQLFKKQFVIYFLTHTFAADLKSKNKMKKVFALILTAGIFVVVACGEGKKTDNSADSADLAQRADALAKSLSTDSSAITVDSVAADTTK
ncbi:hypothetical protein [Solitalea koreensis]|uniref:Uncharacterized protein n=1 Tax=Solitalea koreensis TaxID=543615 RepID=A0A521AP43_9SPHI|nr:hypothetical protein [Solitalea koreensis]SMO36583.1 hypothetical protein SAMN06265350_101291 [Solitalea koreensis]